MNEDKVTLVKVENVDAKAIKELMCIVYEDELKQWFVGREDELYIPGYDSVAMQQYHTWDDKYYKIMYEDESLAGVLLLSTTGREHGRIDRLYILPEYQGKGIGSQALAIVESIYSKVKVWTLETTKFSPRNHYFYEKNGYQLVQEDEEERYYYKVIGEMKYDEKTYHVGQNFVCHNFRDSNLAKTDWYDLNMSESTFSDINLYKALFQNSNMSDTRFTNVNLCNTVIGDTRMENAEICHCNCSNLYIHDINLNKVDNTSVTIERCEIGNSTIRDCNLVNLKIENCNLSGVTINGISVNELLEWYKKESN